MKSSSPSFRRSFISKCRNSGKQKGVNIIMIFLIEVCIMVAIFGVLYAMLQLTSR